MKKTALWILAVLLMLAAAIYQRRTGPTRPFRGSFEAGGATHAYRLVRSEETTRRARVVLPDPGDGSFAARLHYKRFKTDDPFTAEPFVREGDEWAAYLPQQPAAGKMEYFVTLSAGGDTVRIPAEGEDDIVLRYKDPVPTAVLVPHVLMMFFAMLIGMRAGLAALFDPKDMRLWAFVALAGITVGGMILGPVVQKYAFGEYWVGFPFGVDLTDNKTLIMWLAWLAAAAVLGTKLKKHEALGRAVVLGAAVVMTAVYLIPHSMGGSELDYALVDQGVDPAEAIGTGD